MKKLAIFLGSIGALAAAIMLMLPTFVQMAGFHPHFEGEPISLAGKRALIITTSHVTLNVPGETGGEPTGVAASEMTQPYYEFLDAGMQVDLASIKGGEIPVDPTTLAWPIRS
ncbi:MAG: type 1 glutamine amidotransferase domain-containing protein, partial [Pseudomonadota bacterium]